MEGGLVQTIALGALHGTTTFLPVSRSGHWALIGMLFDPEAIGPAEEMAMLLGSLVATLVVVRSELGNIAIALARAVTKPVTLTTTHGGRDLLTVILAQAPAAVFWMLLDDNHQELARQPLIVAVGFFLTAIVLLSTGWIGYRERLHPSSVQALLIGVAEGVALVPGLSRSGCTIAMAMWLGITERRSFELSMLVSVPVTIAAMVRLGTAATSSDASLAPVLVGVGVALATGIGAARVLREVVIRRQLAWFSMWVAPLAIATFAFARAWPTR